MPTFNKFNAFAENQYVAKIDWDSDVFKLAFTNTLPLATNSILSDITQITPGFGYSSGGPTTTITYSRTGGVLSVFGTQVTLTASGGAIASFQYYVLYDDSIATPVKPLVGWWNHGSVITLNDTDSFIVKFNNASPGLILTHQ